MKTRNTIYALLTVLMNMVGVDAFAHDIEVKNSDGITIYYTWQNNKTELAVSYRGTSYDSYSNEYTGVVVIPESVTYEGNTYLVTSIDYRAFYDCSSLTSVTIPSSVTRIEDYAFYSCGSLTSFTIPTSVTHIGMYAFAYDTFENLTIPEAVTYIKYNAFYEATIDSLLIPYAESKIDYSTYKVSGDNYAPFLNTTIRSARIEREFEYVYNGSTPIAPFRKANIENLYVGSKTISWLFEFSTITNLFFEDGITTIPSYALNNRQFANQARSTVKNIHLPEGIETISNYAFAYLGTETINIPSTVKTIGSYAFNSCNLTGKIIFPEGIVSIGEKAFYEGNVTLTQITCLANSPIAISENVFNSTTYTKTLNVPSGSQSLYAEATGWKNFSNIVEMETLSPALTFTDPNVKAICVQSWDANGDGELSEAEAAAVTDLGAVFMQNETITSFDELQYFTGLTSIGYYEFRYCSGLTSVTIPINVTSIGNCAFQYCTGLTSVTVEMETPLTIAEYTFSNRTNATLYVPAGCKAAYEAADYWKEFKEIIEMEAPSPAITFANANVKAICVQNWDTSGDGELSEAEAAAVTDLGTVFRQNKNITSFDELQYFTGLTSIGNGAFRGCSGLTSVTIPNSVTSIEQSAFEGCSGLTSVTIPNSVTSIGGGAFYGCSGLTSVTIPNSVTSIRDQAFYGCRSLTSVTIPNSVTSIGRGAFYGCSGLTSVTIPNSVTSIGHGAFYGCSGLTSVTIPNSVTSIGDYAFQKCSGLTSVTIPNSVTSIGNWAFYECSGLTSVTIPNSVTSIGSYAFYYCSGLTAVKVDKETPLSIVSNTFSNRANATLYVPKGSKAAYQSASYWSDFKAIVEFPDADVNQDGEIDVVDVVDIARFVVGTPGDTFVEFIADLNNSGEVNVADAVVLGAGKRDCRRRELRQGIRSTAPRPGRRPPDADQERRPQHLARHGEPTPVHGLPVRPLHQQRGRRDESPP